eukprot:5593041-Pyramimonas_sp.AAC.1
MDVRAMARSSSPIAAEAPPTCWWLLGGPPPVLLRSGVDRPPTLTRLLANWPFSVRKKSASRPSLLRVQVRRFRSQAVFIRGRFTKGRFVHRRILQDSARPD